MCCLHFWVAKHRNDRGWDGVRPTRLLRDLVRFPAAQRQSGLPQRRRCTTTDPRIISGSCSAGPPARRRATNFAPGSPSLATASTSWPLPRNLPGRERTQRAHQPPPRQPEGTTASPSPLSSRQLPGSQATAPGRHNNEFSRVVARTGDSRLDRVGAFKPRRRPCAPPHRPAGRTTHPLTHIHVRRADHFRTTRHHHRI